MPSAFTGALLGRFSSSTSPTWRILTISSRRTRCCWLSWGKQPPKCARFSFLELVASIAPFARACTWQRKNVTCARCDASGLGIFCFYLAELELRLLDGPPHGQGGQHYVLRSRSFVPIFGCLSDVRLEWCFVALFFSL